MTSLAASTDGLLASLPRLSADHEEQRMDDKTNQGSDHRPVYANELKISTKL